MKEKYFIRKIKDNQNRILIIVAVVCSGVEGARNYFGSLNSMEGSSGLFFMAAFLAIVLHGILEVRNEIRVKRIEEIKYLYPLYRLGIIIFFDAVVFMFVPMFLFLIIFTVFG